jgi:hypothetical protein
MWIAVYDTSDERSLNLAIKKGLHHYAFTRHGSPLLQHQVVFTPGYDQAGNRFPALASCPEEADLVLFFVPGERPSSKSMRVAWEQLPVRDLAALKPAFAVELTSQNPANSNAVQRNGRIFDHVSAGIPFIFASPAAGIRVKTGANIQGGHGSPVYKAAAERLVKQNKPVTSAALGIKLPTHPAQQPSSWPALALLTAADTYDTPAGLLLLQASHGAIPDNYRWSGCQLDPLWKVMDALMGTQGTTRSTAVQALRGLRKQAEALVARGMGTGGSGERHPALLLDGVQHGFPAGSRKSPAAANSPTSSADHYISPKSDASLRATSVGAGGWRAALAAWAGQRASKPALISKLAQAVPTRRLLLEVVINPKYPCKDTYVGRETLFLDHCFVRSDGGTNKTWAVSPNPTARRHLLCYDVDHTAQAFDQFTRSSVYGRRYLQVADLIRCTDKVIVGAPAATLLGVKPGSFL